MTMEGTLKEIFLMATETHAMATCSEEESLGCFLSRLLPYCYRKTTIMSFKKAATHMRFIQTRTLWVKYEFGTFFLAQTVP